MTVQVEEELDTLFTKYTIRVGKEELCDLTEDQANTLRDLEKTGIVGVVGALYLLAVAHERKYKKQQVATERAALEREEGKER
jgi:hypothetical protein